MLTKLALASAMAIPLGLFSLSGAAMAESDWNPNSSYNPPYDIPLYKAAPLQLRTAPARHAAMRCATARKIVREDGYGHVKASECGGGNYVFHATRHGRAVVLHVNPRNGQVWRG